MVKNTDNSNSLYAILTKDGFAIASAFIAGIGALIHEILPNLISNDTILSILLGSVSTLAIGEVAKKYQQRQTRQKIDNIEKSLDAIQESTSDKMEEMLQMLGGNFGQGVTEEDMLDFYDKLKNNATEFHVVWCLKFEVGSNRIDEYLEKEKKLITDHDLKVRRLIHDDINVVEKLKKYSTDLANAKKDYQQLFGYSYRNMEIGYSYYENPLNKHQYARGLIILADNLMRPKIGFYFDSGKNSEHKKITDAIEHMFETEWNICKKRS